MGLIGLVYLRRPNLFILYIVCWGFLLLNVLFGPLSYPEAVVSTGAVLVLALLITSYATGYALTISTIHCRNRFDLSKNNEILINKIGALFALCWAIGGLIYAFPFLIAYDLYSLRISYVYGEKEVSFFSKIGSILSGFSWLLIARIAVNKGVYSPLAAKVTLLSLIMIPLFMAGRQIYMQLGIIFLFGFAISSHFRIERPANLVDISRQLKLTLLIIVILMVAITLLRFSGESLFYESKINQFNKISNTVVTQNYLDYLEPLSPWFVDLLIEFNYYFSSQLIEFLEFVSFSEIVPIDIRIFEKVPFIKANLEKICGLVGYVCFEPKLSTFVGSVSDSSWGTVFSTNISLFGVVGALIVNFIFGVLCAISQQAFYNTPNNLISFNFLLANSVVVFYSIMDSIFSDIYFLVYYILSMFLFFASLKFKLKF